ncbi:DUF4145 domain-containing protein [Microbacterium enclense]|uniref:DUF4145 domain-containing protein n=1 Tax=Microbacterium enclense TaxID=993073 RepID=UPI003F7FCE3F
MTTTTCAWCSAYSTMIRRGEPSIVSRNDMTEELEMQASHSCSHCKKLSIGTLWSEPGQYSPDAISEHHWNSNNASINWVPASIGGRAFPDVPDHIASAADEAYQCASILARRAAILLARGVVEATAKDKGIAAGQLHAKIEALHGAGFVRSFTRDAAHELRYLGNDMAHGDFVETVDDADCESVLNVMSEILNEVYQGPARVARMQAKRQAQSGL